MDTAALTAENQLLREQVGVLVEKLEALSLELARLKRQVVGPKSERRTPEDPAQGLLFATDAEETPTEEPVRDCSRRPMTEGARGCIAHDRPRAVASAYARAAWSFRTL